MLTLNGLARDLAAQPSIAINDAPNVAAYIVGRSHDVEGSIQLAKSTIEHPNLNTFEGCIYRLRLPDSFLERPPLN